MKKTPFFQLIKTRDNEGRITIFPQLTKVRGNKWTIKQSILTCTTPDYLSGTQLIMMTNARFQFEWILWSWETVQFKNTRQPVKILTSVDHWSKTFNPSNQNVYLRFRSLQSVAKIFRHHQITKTTKYHGCLQIIHLLFPGKIKSNVPMWSRWISFRISFVVAGKTSKASAFFWSWSESNP